MTKPLPGRRAASVEPQNPGGSDTDLGSLRPVMYDASCGEPVAWGFDILRRLSASRFGDLRSKAALACAAAGSCVVITRRLTRKEAIEKYGAVTQSLRGLRGGWRSDTFGVTRFCTRWLRDPKEGQA